MAVMKRITPFRWFKKNPASKRKSRVNPPLVSAPKERPYIIFVIKEKKLKTGLLAAIGVVVPIIVAIIRGLFGH